VRVLAILPTAVTDRVLMLLRERMSLWRT